MTPPTTPDGFEERLREALEREYQCAVDDCPSCEHNVDRSLAAVLPLIRDRLAAVERVVESARIALASHDAGGCTHEECWYPADMTRDAITEYDKQGEQR